MNELKYKAWDKIHHCYFPVIAIGILSKEVVGSDRCLKIGEQCDLLNYIPIAEENNKDVFEGDLVRYCNEDGDCIIGTFTFENDPDNEQCEVWCGWKLKKLKDITNDWYNEQGEWKGDNLETKWDGNICIIGNINENKSLWEIILNESKDA